MSELNLRLRPVTVDDLPMLQRFLTEPFLLGPDWRGFQDAQSVTRRFAKDGFLGEEDGRLIVEVDPTTGSAGTATAEATEPDGGSAEPDGGSAEPGGPADGAAAGLVSWQPVLYGGVAKHWEIGIVLLPEWRGRGIGWRAQAMLCDYLFSHTPAHRIAAGTQAENTAEQRSLEKAGFHLEGVLRACEFRAGQWRDGHLYSRLRTDPSPVID
ncbi:GNAT family N-acetyltransferase [Plantactinospora sp. GCM10030261]|uniref:GNAT family N-acetyltransferase n=1 Tax=Plantactinospora sp. GCM10030261 TaxID=3273420 RepID=UPI0036120D08